MAFLHWFFTFFVFPKAENKADFSCDLIFVFVWAMQSSQFHLLVFVADAKCGFQLAATRHEWTNFNWQCHQHKLMRKTMTVAHNWKQWSQCARNFEQTRNWLIEMWTQGKLREILDETINVFCRSAACFFLCGSSAAEQNDWQWMHNCWHHLLGPCSAQSNCELHWCCNNVSSLFLFPILPTHLNSLWLDSLASWVPCPKCTMMCVTRPQKAPVKKKLPTIILGFSQSNHNCNIDGTLRKPGIAQKDKLNLQNWAQQLTSFNNMLRHNFADKDELHISRGAHEVSWSTAKNPQTHNPLQMKEGWLSQTNLHWTEKCMCIEIWDKMPILFLTSDQGKLQHASFQNCANKWQCCWWIKKNKAIVLDSSVADSLHMIACSRVQKFVRLHHDWVLMKHLKLFAVESHVPCMANNFLVREFLNIPFFRSSQVAQPTSYWQWQIGRLNCKRHRGQFIRTRKGEILLCLSVCSSSVFH